MKQIFAKKGGVEVEEVEEPICKENEVKVKVKISAISVGTELRTYKKFKQPLYKSALQNKELAKKVLKRIKDDGLFNILNSKKELIPSKWPLGYSCAGVVIESKTEAFKTGDIVACGGQGYASHAEIIVVPKNLAVKVPEGVDLEEAAHTTLGAIAIHGIRRLNPSFGETVVVYGLGLLGNITAQILQAIGCKVIGIGRDKKRAAKTKTDVTFTEDVVNGVHKETKGEGADGVILTLGSDDKSIITKAMQMCRKKAKVVIVGVVPLEIERTIMYEKEIDLLMSTAYGPGRYDPEYEERGHDYPLAYVRWTENRNMQEFLRLLQQKKISIKPLIEKRCTLNEAKEVYSSLYKAKDKPLSTIFQY